MKRIAMHAMNTPARSNVVCALISQEGAVSRFNEVAEPALIDIAIHEMAAAELRLSVAISESRSLFCLNTLDKQTNGGKRKQKEVRDNGA